MSKGKESKVEVSADVLEGLISGSSSYVREVRTAATPFAGRPGTVAHRLGEGVDPIAVGGALQSALLAAGHKNAAVRVILSIYATCARSWLERRGLEAKAKKSKEWYPDVAVRVSESCAILGEKGEPSRMVSPGKFAELINSELEESERVTFWTPETKRNNEVDRCFDDPQTQKVLEIQKISGGMVLFRLVGSRPEGGGGKKAPAGKAPENPLSLLAGLKV